MARPNYDTIVIAIDFSSATESVLRRGLDLAARLGAHAEVVYTTPRLQPALPFHRGNRAAVAKLQREEVTGARAALADLVADCDPRVGTRVRIGSAHAEILTHAKEKGAGLIVLGKRGHNLAENLLLGSTADRVLRKATVPVIVVPVPIRRD
jgi:nucleotide-binding universal stress UspA family protein